MKSTIKSQDFEIIFDSLRNAKQSLFVVSKNFTHYNSEECGLDTDANKVWSDVLSCLESLNDIHDFVLDLYKNV